MTTAQSVRPTREVSVIILDSLDDMVGQLLDRLDGITDAEYLWQPVADAWNVRPEDATVGTGLIDTSDDRDIDPAPVTTIAWRMWHLSVDCLDDYTRRLDGHADDVQADRTWFLAAESAIDALRASWASYRSALLDRGNWWTELGSEWGPWSRHCIGDMAMHASNELVHHGAEIALLRDLYRSRSPD